MAGATPHFSESPLWSPPAVVPEPGTIPSLPPPGIASRLGTVDAAESRPYNRPPAGMFEVGERVMEYEGFGTCGNWGGELVPAVDAVANGMPQRQRRPGAPFVG